MTTLTIHLPKAVVVALGLYAATCMAAVTMTGLLAGIGWLIDRRNHHWRD